MEMDYSGCDLSSECILDRQNNLMLESGCDCDISVYFNTHFRYLLGSNYIACFGGEENGYMDMSEMKWVSSERPQILQKLQTYSHPLPDFASFVKNTTGTQDLNTSLEAYGHCAFRFGCLLYHQLGYCEELSGIFETGRCHQGDTCWHASHH
jgi:hypothetical protein